MVSECRDIAKDLNIEGELMDEKISKAHFKQIVKTAICKKNEEILREDIARHSKLKMMEGESCHKKKYLTEMSLEDARLYFRIRCNMTEFGFNFKNKKEYSETSWSCISCKSAIDTFNHAKWCIAHEDLREGIDLDNEIDLVRYISKVLNRRAKKV